MKANHDNESLGTGPNPYAPPNESDQSDRVPVQTPETNRRRSWDVWGLLILLAGCTALCVFVVGAAIYELTTMPEDAYGIHRPMMRNNYIRAGVISFTLATATVIAAFRLHRAKKYGVSVAVCTVLAVIWAFTNL